MEVNRENMQKWVDALRSGNYEQGKGRLKSMTSSYCCLGVACDISGLGEWDEHNDYVTPRGSAQAYLPLEVAEWLGVDRLPGYDNPPLIDKNGVEEDPALLNDELGYTFEQIADAIERTYLT